MTQKEMETKARELRSLLALILQAIMSKAYKLSLIDRNPTETARLDMPEVEEAEVEIFSKDEAAHMLSCLDGEPLKFQLLIHLAIVTGARRANLSPCNGSIST